MTEDFDDIEHMTERQEQNWGALLGNAADPGTPRPLFKAALLAELKGRVRAQAEAPSDKFRSDLLQNLRQTQRNDAERRWHSRRRALFMSVASSLAAAAIVMFIVWVQPSLQQQHEAALPLTEETALIQSAAVPAAAQPAASAERTLAEATGYTPYVQTAAFSGPALPATMRGIGMQVDRGDGWTDMDATLITAVEPGMRLRARTGTDIAGAGFGDGSTITVRPGAIIETTNRGLAVRQGAMTVNVPAGGTNRLYMHFDQRDLAVEPGTMLAVNVPDASLFADGGAPAPEVKVLDGGMALARGTAGNGIMLANRVYRLDNYVTADMPSRPLTEWESEELANMPMPLPRAQVGAHLVAGAPLAGAASRPTLTGYTQHGSRWVADTWKDQPLVRVRWLSDDYFTLAGARRDLAAPLSLGANVIIDGGDGNFYEIYR